MTTGVSSVYRTVFEIGPHPRVNGSDIALYVTSASATPFGFASGGNTLLSTGSAASGQVYHIVIVYDGSKKYLYINGFLNNSAAYTSFNGVQNMTMQIGRNNHANANEGVDGSISNFKMYVGHALTAEEVNTLYDMGRCDEGHHTTTVSRSQLRMGGENLVIEPCIKGFYEEGTWSPYIAGSTSGACYPSASNYGWFIRVGNLVTIGGTVAWSGYSGAISGNRQIMGLPYPARNVPNARTAMTFGVTTSTGLWNGVSSGTTFRLVLDPGYDFIFIASSNETAGQWSTYNIASTTIDSTGVIYGLGGTYRI
jgi:hypothetical protein